MSRVPSRLAASLLAAVLIAAALPGSATAADPAAANDEYTVPVNSDETELSVLDNDTGDGLTIVDVTDPAHGTATIGDGVIAYTPDPDFHDIDTFQYTIEDTEGDPSTATVTVIVNDPPVVLGGTGPHCDLSAFGGGFPVPEDVYGDPPESGAPPGYFALFGDCAPLARISDPNGDPLTWEVVDQPLHGHVLSLPGAPAFVAYDPDPDYSDTGIPGAIVDLDTFTYRASDGWSDSNDATFSFWVGPINDPPTFTPGPLVVIVDEDSGPVSIPWATDISPGPQNESTQEVHFEVETDLNGVPDLFDDLPAIDGDGVLTFTPFADEVGLVHVTVTATDDGKLDTWNMGSIMPPPKDTSEPVQFDIIVQPKADAKDDHFTILEGSGPQVFDVLENDDGYTSTGPYVLTSVSTPSKGTATISGPSTVTYTPNPGASGQDSFTYTATDDTTATVTITVGPNHTEPDSIQIAEDADATVIPVLANDALPSGSQVLTAVGAVKGAVSVTPGGGSVTYKPNKDVNGTDTFSYTVTGGLSALVTVTITPVNDAPLAKNDTGIVPEGAPATALSVLGNDGDADGDALRIIDIPTKPAHGTVVITGGGTGLTYRPAAGYSGSDTFKYRVSDDHGGQDDATVLVTVTPDKTPPTVTAPAQRFLAQTVSTKTVKVRLSWSATDAGSGIASYKLQVSRNGGKWSTIALPKPTATSIDRPLAAGSSYRYRLRATDGEGNTSTYALGPAMKWTRYSQTNGKVAYTGKWSNSKQAKAIGGSTRRASAASRRATLTFTARDVAWIATKTKSSGKAQVLIDGVLVATVDLRASTAYRKLVLQRHFPTSGPHTLQIRPVGNGRVDIDGFLVLK